MTTIYVSGPMSNRPEFNFPAFHEATAELRQAGYMVINPAENWGGVQDVPRAQCMRLDIQQVLVADGIAVLPEWYASAGARLEVDIAIAVDIPVHSVDEWLGM